MQPRQLLPGFGERPKLFLVAASLAGLVIPRPLAVILIPQSPFDFAHGPEPVEGRKKDLALVLRCEILRRFAPQNDGPRQRNARRFALQVRSLFRAAFGMVQNPVNVIEDVPLRDLLDALMLAEMLQRPNDFGASRLRCGLPRPAGRRRPSKLLRAAANGNRGPKRVKCGV